VLLLGEVLASLAPSDEFFSVAQGSGPVVKDRYGEPERGGVNGSQ
jgi:hypothetical protein